MQHPPREPSAIEDSGHELTLAKLGQPVLTVVHHRVRLFRRLDRARKCPIVWISAPAGAGKTTLVASYASARRLPVVWYRMDSGDNDAASFFYYLGLAAKQAAPRNPHTLPVLTREYVAGLPTFTANFFRELFARLKNPGIVVFDNCQDVDADGVIQEVLRWGLEEIPPGMTVILMSRQDPSTGLARLRASERVSLLGWEELRLTQNESKAIVKLRHPQAPPGEMIERLYRETRGWVAGLVLLTEQDAAALQTQSHAKEFASQAVFDYFASEIFRRTDPIMRQFLLQTAFLPKLSPAIARGLTEQLGSEAILRDLTRRNYFTTQHVDGSYEYHPLFRAFLASRASETLTDEQIKGLKQRSAKLLADAGDIETAVTLLQQAEDWRSAVDLVLKHAAALLAQGRTQTLDRWLTSIPDELRLGNPWVLYWLGTCRLLSAPMTAREHLEQAFALFEIQTDAAPLYLTWSRVIDSFLIEMNDFAPMIQWLERYSTLSDGRVPPPVGIENASIFFYVLGLINARSDHPDLAIYAERAQKLLKHETNIERKHTRTAAVMAYRLWSGNVTEVASLLETLTPSPQASTPASAARLTWYVWKSMYSATIGAAAESLQATNEGLALADACGVHILDLQLLGFGMRSQLHKKDAPIRALLQRMSTVARRGQGEEALYRNYAALAALYENDVAGAIDEARRSVELAKASNLYVGQIAYLTTLAYALARGGATDAALDALTEGRAKVLAMRSKRFMSDYDFCEAVIRHTRGESAQCLAALRHAISLAREMGVTLPNYICRDDAALLCAIALEAGIHTDFVEAAIAKLQLSPPASCPEKWPWPIRIYTLGSFVVLKDGKPLDCGSRAGKKPLELLRALVMFGGRDVSVAKLVRALWPDEESSAAKGALETTLYRLRRLIGEGCILRQENQLTLNPECCWFDLRAFDLIAENLGGSLSRAAAARRLLDLYRGPFFGADDSPLLNVQRERLRSKFLRTLVQLGQGFERESNIEVAISCYEKGLDIEPLAEDVYRRLMHCHVELDRPVEALLVYQRCKGALESLLQLPPTAETQSLYRRIRQRAAAHSG